MSYTPVPVDGKRLDWPRLVANAINRLLNISEAQAGYLGSLDAEPADPAEGDLYYDLTTHTMRYRNDTAWVDL